MNEEKIERRWRSGVTSCVRARRSARFLCQLAGLCQIPKLTHPNRNDTAPQVAGARLCQNNPSITATSPNFSSCPCLLAHYR